MASSASSSRWRRDCASSRRASSSIGAGSASLGLAMGPMSHRAHLTERSSSTAGGGCTGLNRGFGRLYISVVARGVEHDLALVGQAAGYREHLLLLGLD